MNINYREYMQNRVKAISSIARENISLYTFARQVHIERIYQEEGYEISILLILEESNSWVNRKVTEAIHLEYQTWCVENNMPILKDFFYPYGITLRYSLWLDYLYANYQSLFQGNPRRGVKGKVKKVTYNTKLPY